jgi:hypothetical protein
MTTCPAPRAEASGHGGRPEPARDQLADELKRGAENGDIVVRDADRTAFQIDAVLTAANVALRLGDNGAVTPSVASSTGGSHPHADFGYGCRLRSVRAGRSARTAISVRGFLGATSAKDRPVARPATQWAADATRGSAIHEPLNNDLIDAGDPSRIADLAGVRDDFEDPWVAWHIVRTVLTTAALGALAYALVLHGRAERELAQRRAGAGGRADRRSGAAADAPAR